MSIIPPSEKKKILMSLIDDMAAAALDRSSQGYSQFLQCRSRLIEVIENYAKEDEMRIEFVMSTMKKAEEVYKNVIKIPLNNCTNNLA